MGMSTAQYQFQTRNGRFRIYETHDAATVIPEFKGEDCQWHLLEFDAGGKFLRLVGSDGGEPEDQLLVRDWQWVAEELNRMAAWQDQARAAGWAPRPESASRFDCPEHGKGVSADEDGCCSTCGADCQQVDLEADLAAARAELTKVLEERRAMHRRAQQAEGEVSEFMWFVARLGYKPPPGYESIDAARLLLDELNARRVCMERHAKGCSFWTLEGSNCSCGLNTRQDEARKELTGVRTRAANLQRQHEQERDRLRARIAELEGKG